MALVAFSEIQLCPISCSKLPPELPSSKLPSPTLPMKRFDGNAYNFGTVSRGLYFPQIGFFF